MTDLDDLLRRLDAAPPDDWEGEYASIPVDLTRNQVRDVAVSGRTFSPWFALRFDAGPPGVVLPSLDNSLESIMRDKNGTPAEAYRVVLGSGPFLAGAPREIVFAVLNNAFVSSLAGEGEWFPAWLADKVGLACVAFGELKRAWELLDAFTERAETHPNLAVLKKFSALRASAPAARSLWVQASVCRLWPRLGVIAVPRLPDPEISGRDLEPLDALLAELTRIGATELKALVESYVPKGDDVTSSVEKILADARIAASRLQGAGANLRLPDVEREIARMSLPTLTTNLITATSVAASDSEPVEGLLVFGAMRRAIEGSPHEKLWRAPLSDAFSRAIGASGALSLSPVRLAVLDELIAAEGKGVRTSLSRLLFFRANTRRGIPSNNASESQLALDDLDSALRLGRETGNARDFAVAAAAWVKTSVWVATEVGEWTQDLVRSGEALIQEALKTELDPQDEALVHQAHAHLLRLVGAGGDVAAFERAIDLLPRDDRFWVEIASEVVATLVRAGRANDALVRGQAYLDAASSRVRPIELGMLHGAVGEARLKLGRLDEAKRYLESALGMVRGRDSLNEAILRWHLVTLHVAGGEVELWHSHLRLLVDHRDELDPLMRRDVDALRASLAEQGLWGDDASNAALPSVRAKLMFEAGRTEEARAMLRDSLAGELATSERISCLHQLITMLGEGGFSEQAALCDQLEPLLGPDKVDRSVRIDLAYALRIVNRRNVPGLVRALAQIDCALAGADDGAVVVQGRKVRAFILRDLHRLTGQAWGEPAPAHGASRDGQLKRPPIPSGSLGSVRPAHVDVAPESFAHSLQACARSFDGMSPAEALQASADAWAPSRAHLHVQLASPQARDLVARAALDVALALANCLGDRAPRVEAGRARVDLHGGDADSVLQWLLRSQASTGLPMRARLARPEAVAANEWIGWIDALESLDPSRIHAALHRIWSVAPSFLSADAALEATWRWLQARPNSASISLFAREAVILVLTLRVSSSGARESSIVGLEVPAPPVPLDDFHAQAFAGVPGADFRSSQWDLVRWLRSEVVDPVVGMLAAPPSVVLWNPGPQLRLLAPRGVWGTTPVAMTTSVCIPDLRTAPGRRSSTLLVLADPGSDGSDVRLDLRGAGLPALDALERVAAPRGPVRLLASVGSRYGRQLLGEHAHVRDTPASATELLAEAAEHEVIVVIAHGVVETPESAALLCVNGAGRVDRLDVSRLARNPGHFAGATIVLLACQGGRVGDGIAEPGGLAGTLISAGARGVVAPLWPVRLDVAQQVAAAILEGLEAGTEMWTVLARLQIVHSADSPELGGLPPKRSIREAEEALQRMSFVVWVA